MHILLVEPDYYTRYPPLGLLKLAAWHKQQRDTVELRRGILALRDVWKDPDRVYVTSLWTWEWRAVHAAVNMSRACFPKAEIWLGGIYASLMPEHAKTAGADVVHPGLITYLEDLLPDYELLPAWHFRRRASVLFTHRGCVRSCAFCAVPKLEGKPFQPRPTSSIRHLVHPNHKRVVLWDNNILGEPHWKDVIEELKSLRVEVDFNQGLDARFINETVAEALKGLRIPMIRVAYDFPGIGKFVKRAIELLEAVGFRRREMLSYVLFNFKDNPEDLFTRVRDLLDWGITAYPMRYQPLNGPYALEKDSYVAPTWTPRQLEMVAEARRVIGYGGAFPAYKGLQKKFLKARSFEEAFGLRPELRKVFGAAVSVALLTEMSEDHQWPLARNNGMKDIPTAEVIRTTRIEGQQLCYLEQRGYIRPRHKKRGKKRFKFYSKRDLELLRAIKWYLDQGHKYRLAVDKAREDLRRIARPHRT